MTYYLLGNLILDENLRPLTSLRRAVLGDVRQQFAPLTRSDAKRLLDVLWLETYASSHDTVPKGEVGRHANWAEATYAWRTRIIMQMTMCPKDCPKKPPHVHVDEARINELAKRSNDYATIRVRLYGLVSPSRTEAGDAPSTEGSG